MTRQHVNFLLLGGGIAANEAARAIRSSELTASILMIARESARPYRRPELSKSYLQRKESRESIFVDNDRWQTQNNIVLKSGTSAQMIDTGRHAVLLDSGEEFFYDRLLIATGCAPRRLGVPGDALPNVHTLRNVNDADRLLHAIDVARIEGLPVPDGATRGRATVVGGGLLGVEVAASLRALGLHVELVVGRGHPWSNYAGDVVGRSIARSLEAGGVVLHVDRTVTRLEGDGRVQRVVLSDGSRIDTNLVVTCVGVDATQDLLRNTPIASEKAILVDAQCRTNIEDVFAAGDCCAAFDPAFGRHRYFPHWNQAAMLGATAGDGMAGGTRRVDPATLVDSGWFDQTGLICGDRKLVHHRIVRQQADQVVEFGVANDGRVAQIVALGSVDEKAVRSLIARRTNVVGREEQLKDPTVPLASLTD